ncbi:MAG: hypothetical protein JSV16_03175 [Candidatus Hydrogenedentota bacterium]|nr:MAG: hypothetical protein JSV16_03175 [Candidatus Hydrogenedentota bacterium]
MQKTGFVTRFVIPAAIVLVTTVVTSLIYHHLAWKIEGRALHTILAHVSAVILFVSIGFGALLIYPMAFFRGAHMGERILACLITPVVWNAKEMVRVSEFFNFGETLYYGLNSIFLLCVFGALGQMGLCELICRWRLGKRGEEPVRVFSPLPVISILASLVALYVFLIWGLGVHFFYIYIEGYRAIFS